MNPERFREVQEIFHKAIERAPGDREAFVLEVSEGDVELRQELLSLLGAHRNDGFLESAWVETDSPLAGPLSDGQSIGPYRVQREIGRGGMGVVYLAEDTRLNRRVALKALRPDLTAGSKEQERFRREAIVAASLSHPAIATIYAFEELAGRFFIVSEYVPGETLRAEMNQGPLAPGRVLVIALRLASALAAAHEQGVVHRDLKPENIVCVNRDKLKIVDFGLALGPGTRLEDPRLTLSGTLIGTPAYMSPEQLGGGDIDHRSDMYSFGILLYELLLGEHPFGGGTSLGTPARILGSEPAGGDRLREAAPGLDRIILRCLEKAPDRRFGSTREIVDELETFARSGFPRPQPRPATPEVSDGEESGLPGHWWRVHQMLVIALYGTMIVLLFVLNAPRDSRLLTGCAFLSLALGAWNGATRVHLLFTSGFNRKAIRAEVGRTAALLRGFDLGFSLTLVVASLTLLPSSQPWAAVLGAVGVSYAAVSLVVEPATIRSVFSVRPGQGE